MNLSYFGHCAIRIKLDSRETLLFDPFGNQQRGTPWFKLPFPSIRTDFLIITHPHFDHENVDAIVGTPTIIRHPITLATEHFQLTGLLDKHARGFGAEWGAWNIIFMLEAEGLKLCHWGDNRAALSDEQWAQLGTVDILFVTVDDHGHLLEFEEVAEIVERLQPKIVFPTHYFIEGLSTESSGLAGIGKWLAEQTTISYIPSATIMLSKENLPQQTEVWVFEQIAGDSLL